MKANASAKTAARLFSPLRLFSKPPFRKRLFSKRLFSKPPFRKHLFRKRLFSRLPFRKCLFRKRLFSSSIPFPI